MVLNEKKWEDKKFGRWIEENEIIIEDISEQDILNVAERMAKSGYNLEYWKAKKQKSGHLHIKNIIFPEKEKLNKKQLSNYREFIVKKYVREELWDKVDWKVVKHKHRIVEEGKNHYKGYGIKELKKSWNEDKENYREKDIYLESKKEINHIKNIDLKDQELLINKFEKEWVEGNRQNTALSLSGYLRKKGFGIEKIKSIIKEICERTKDISELSMRLKAVDETFKKDESEIKGISGFNEKLQRSLTQPKIEVQKLEFKDYNYFKKLKKDKSFLIDGFLYPNSVNMIYSPPAQFKSLIALNMGLALSNKKDWLGLEINKRIPVLYLDGENNEQIIKDRLEKNHKGMNLKRNKFPYYTLKGGLLMDSKKNINLSFLTAIEEFIKEKKIKVVIFDTLHRFCFYDENKSDDINLLYTQVFRPLVDNLKVSIIFLHHSTKGGSYRGSGDFLGMVDTSYRVQRNGKSNSFSLINEKCRSGEIGNISGNILFGEDYIKLFREQEKEESSETIINKLKEVTSKIESLLSIGSEMRRKDFIDALEIQEFDFGAVKNIDRALKFLVDRGVFDKIKSGVYIKV